MGKLGWEKMEMVGYCGDYFGKMDGICLYIILNFFFSFVE